MVKTDAQTIEEVLSRGVSEVIVKEDLEKKLLSGKKLRIYLGVDPTGFSLHLGHAVVLRKLKEFLDLGHEVILLIGDFTAKIGDPTGKDTTRIPLTDKQIKENFKDYKKQASKVLNFSKVKIKYNSVWLSKLRFEDVLKLVGHFTVQQMLHRDMFDKRVKENAPINQTEFLYPLMQGYDSVAMDVDVEIGGNDQMFNMLAGRTLQKIYHNKDKDILTTKLLLGTDGRKMSKTYDNAIYLTDEPNDMYGKIMSIKDELIGQYFELATNLDEQKITEILSMPNPRDQKALLAKEIVTMYHGEKAAIKAAENFDKVFRQHQMPSEIEIFKTDKTTYPILDLLCDTKLAPSKNEAKRLVEGGGVTVRIKNEELRIKNWREEIAIEDELIIQAGKRKFIKIKVI
ncbi:MAG: tyrosine--tRNA ligase [Candidatus Staskawiczbacteria bacterium RIFCSPLOWO2_01_FULL_40_39]|uniref:Tyrosine--tRNA ligase n=1 Tax=Candidatus Staskawiczbacteria bacterium RIFCSPHIGHO2_01_FULL_39_25 TaxID=1802202 RepID=A0A1G2HMD9_9BACT|nr:MAG: tyrosine--tRNA ligase [Candidatus Staskawiczbacteria bacterium RIFCSPHIGHO2_01_FULL_39_25]OGZ73682.1 MAG: tyrosine--tRNA ligase [Candidatus Staskawiczbacteria bacterium RIFCSPLOWO2_01_FULL_40_39]